MSEQQKWQTVCSEPSGAYTLRMQVPGGHLYRLQTFDGALGLAFVPDEPDLVDWKTELADAITERDEATAALRRAVELAERFERERDEARQEVESMHEALARAAKYAAEMTCERDEARVLAAELRGAADRLLAFDWDYGTPEPTASRMRALSVAADRVPAEWEVEP
jgi:hypothetical protein